MDFGFYDISEDDNDLNDLNDCGFSVINDIDSNIDMENIGFYVPNPNEIIKDNTKINFDINSNKNDKNYNLVLSNYFSEIGKKINTEIINFNDNDEENVNIKDIILTTFKNIKNFNEITKFNENEEDDEDEDDEDEDGYVLKNPMKSKFRIIEYTKLIPKIRKLVRVSK
jgi:hypothetical protein